MKNKVMKKIFQGIKLGKDAGEKQIELLKKISSLIEENRLELIQETFRNSKIGYGKFNNPSRFRCAKDEICCLWGYYVDTGRKTKLSSNLSRLLFLEAGYEFLLTKIHQ